MKNMIELAKRTRIFLTKNKNDLDLHMIRRFPSNSCETSSLLLGMVFKEVFPEKKIIFVEGYNHPKNQTHFWIECNNQVYDITADQFINIKQPIYGEKQQPSILKHYNSITRSEIEKQLVENDFATTKITELKNAANRIIQNT